MALRKQSGGLFLVTKSAAVIPQGRNTPTADLSPMDHQNENPFSQEGGFSFCIIHYSLFIIHYSLNENGFSNEYLIFKSLALLNNESFYDSTRLYSKSTALQAKMPINTPRIIPAKTSVG